MRQEISVKKAINRGQVMVNVPVFICLIGCPALGMYLSKRNLIPHWGIGIAFILGFILAWIMWSFMITKWRIWAFGKVRNVHELKKSAIEAKLIWNDGSVFEKTEIRSRQDSQELQKLDEKFEKEDFYREDYSLPPKTKIYYSKTTNYFELGVALLILCIGVYLIILASVENYIFGAIMIAIGLFASIKGIRKNRDKTPKISIDRNGIETQSTAFKNWSEIEGEEVIQEGYGKTLKSYLIYYYDDYDRFEKMDIGDLDVSFRALENMLRTYRIRNNKNAI